MSIHQLYPCQWNWWSGYELDLRAFDSFLGYQTEDKGKAVLGIDPESRESNSEPLDLDAFMPHTESR